jgi:hypothetical protein
VVGCGVGVAGAVACGAAGGAPTGTSTYTYSVMTLGSCWTVGSAVGDGSGSTTAVSSSPSDFASSQPACDANETTAKVTTIVREKERARAILRDIGNLQFVDD